MYHRYIGFKKDVTPVGVGTNDLHHLLKTEKRCTFEE